MKIEEFYDFEFILREANDCEIRINQFDPKIEKTFLVFENIV